MQQFCQEVSHQPACRCDRGFNPFKNSSTSGPLRL